MLLSLQYTLGAHRKADAEYLDACRIKRNHVEYDYINGASETEAQELVDFVRELRKEVVEKLAPKYPNLGSMPFAVGTAPRAVLILQSPPYEN